MAVFSKESGLASGTIAHPHPVLILGAGINGAAIARELTLNGVPVCVVDHQDIACGATSKSSRLIHGGLRYLEYGDFHLVRESLEERARLLRLAPQFVSPLRLFIPIRNRAGGLVESASRFLGLTRSRLGGWVASRFRPATGRGLWLVDAGLSLYDRFAGEEGLPGHSLVTEQTPDMPSVDRKRYPWLCAYSDAQMLFPERFVIAELEDARLCAEAQEVEFHVYTYHRVQFTAQGARILPLQSDSAVRTFEPSLVINATGAWGDQTLRELQVPTPRLFGGTKGSHFITFHSPLRLALGDNAVYAEADDGRLVFVLPFRDAVLVGTTDERFDQDPGAARATPDELAYLMGMVNRVFPQVRLTQEHIELHYSGVRPLPVPRGGPAAAITRDHSIITHRIHNHPLLTIVGGKLTTCRSLAEQVADQVFQTLGVQRRAETRERPYPGGSAYPTTPSALAEAWERLAAQFDVNMTEVLSLWSLIGNRTEKVLTELEGHPHALLPGTAFPLAFVQWVIENEWVAHLDDLVERRLMLLFSRELSEQCLRQLAGCLVETGRLAADEVEAAVQSTIIRLQQHYGKRVVSDLKPADPGAV